MDERIKIIPKFACPRGHEHSSEQDALWCVDLQGDLLVLANGYRDMESNLRDLEARLKKQSCNHAIGFTRDTQDGPRYCMDCGAMEDETGTAAPDSPGPKPAAKKPHGKRPNPKKP